MAFRLLRQFDHARRYVHADDLACALLFYRSAEAPFAAGQVEHRFALHIAEQVEVGELLGVFLHRQFAVDDFVGERNIIVAGVHGCSLQMRAVGVGSRRL
ncbi:hypothetical protein D3C80_1748880 [compost metagenome]